MNDYVLNRGVNNALPTKGDEIRDTIDEYSEFRGQDQLNALRNALVGTGVKKLDNLLEKLEKWLVRKRPSSTERPIEAEIIGAIASIRRCAGDYHSLPASVSYINRINSYEDLTDFQN